MTGRFRDDEYVVEACMETERTKTDGMGQSQKVGDPVRSVSHRKRKILSLTPRTDTGAGDGAIGVAPPVFDANPRRPVVNADWKGFQFPSAQLLNSQTTAGEPWS